MRSRTITQIALVLLSAVVIFTYIKPKFSDLRLIQDDIVEYKQAVSQAGEFNQKLEELLSRANGFSQANLKSLEAYLPKEIDTVLVARTISTLAAQSGLEVDSIALGESQEQIIEEEDLFVDPAIDELGLEGELIEEGLSVSTKQPLITHNFTTEVSGRYENFKKFLTALESNSYPLEIKDLKFSAGEDSDEIKFSLGLETYSLPAPK